MEKRHLQCSLGILVLLTCVVIYVEGQGCGEGKWQCDDGQCIWPIEKCNGFRSGCSDFSDEHPRVCGADCELVNGGGFPCADGQQCIRADRKCDGREDCEDGSDEHSSVCGPDCGRVEYIRISDGKKIRGGFLCADKQQCIKAEFVCDGEDHCHDFSDESAAPCGKRPSLSVLVTPSSMKFVKFHILSQVVIS